MNSLKDIRIHSLFLFYSDNVSNICLLVSRDIRPVSYTHLDVYKRQGVRGANGVILVTTKRGILEGMKVHASYQFGINTLFRLPDMADGYTYALAMNEALRMDGLSALLSLIHIF